ncbi:MAG TPA: EF-P beta-lysylation protein EpmB, partial [Chromatiaceae bacterium]|nr:EF-P beta-lysylation protein EpmB [Chromatiaceae bacterium]
MSLKTESWQQQMAEGYCSIQKLLNDLELPGHFRPEMETAAKVFGFRVPRYFAALMQKG